DINNHPRHGIARLQSNGRLDESFDPGLILRRIEYGFSDPVIYSVTLQPDGKSLIAGNFTNVAGSARGGLARLNTDGSVDPTFIPNCADSYFAYRVVSQSYLNV